MKSVPSRWISAHLFYYDAPEPLLIQCVQPLVENLRARQLIERFFFIRYWQGGPHIRLRLLTADGVSQGEIRALLEEHVAQFFATSPSVRQIQQENYERNRALFSTFEYGRGDQTPLYPNNSLQYIPYAPEYDRYGGDAAMPVVEQFFMESSEIVLDMLRHSLTRNQLTSYALTMLLQGIGMYADTPALLSRLCECYYHWALPHASVYPAHFERQYQQQSQRLSELVSRTLGLQQSGFHDDTFLKRWSAAIRRLQTRLQHLEQQGDLQLGASPRYLVHLEKEHNPAFLGIIFSCQHMHNNRLGLSLLEEAYLAFLAQRALSSSLLLAEIQ